MHENPLQLDTAHKNTVENWQTVFNSVNDLIIILDIDNRILDANPAVFRATGLRDDQVIGHRCYTLFHCTDRPPCDCPYEKLKETFQQESLTMEMEALGRNYLVTVSPIFDGKSGEVTRVVHIAKDITELKITETALTLSEKKFQSIFQTASDGILVADIENKMFVDANQAIGEMLGYTRDEILQLNVSDIHPRDELPRIVEIFEKQVKGEIVVASELPVMRKDGSIFFADISSKPVTIGEQNLLIGIFRDATRRLQAEQSLRVEKDTAQKYLDVAGVMLAALNAAGEITLINQKGCEILQVTEAEALGKNWFDCYLPPRMVAEVKDVFNKLMSGLIEPVEYFENPVLTSTGDEKIIAFHNKVLKDESGNITGVLFSGEDITERKRIENEKNKLESQLQQAQKMEALGTLAGGIAHDFNNLLAVIIGNTELCMLDLPGESESNVLLDQVIQTAWRARDLVRQILAFSRQAGQELKPIEPALVVQEVIKLLRSTIPATVEIRQRIDPECGTIIADPTQIHQLIMNLATNAVHAMQEKGVLEIRLEQAILGDDDLKHRPDMIPGPHVSLSISDTGTGMDPLTKDRIFEPFFTTKDIGQGTGLGLSVVHGIVTAHHGMITVDSTPGQGSTFQVYFAKAASDEVELAERIQPFPTGSERILLVDDEKDIVSMWENILKRLGYQPTTVNNSSEALAIFLDQPEQFDLVITDQTMPGMTGAELAGKMMATRPDIPIILCTGHSSKLSSKEAETLGIRKYLMKPVSTWQLATSIREILDAK